MILTSGDRLTDLENLALITYIRKYFSSSTNSWETKISKVLTETKLMSLIKQNLQDGLFIDNEIKKCVQLESLWILSNLSYGSNDNLSIIMNPTYEMIPITKKLLSSSFDIMVVEELILLFLNLNISDPKFNKVIYNDIKIIDVVPKLFSNEAALTNL